MSLLTFLCRIPNSGNGLFSNFLIKMQEKYLLKDFYYFYLGQKIYCSRQGFTWLDDSNNWRSLGFKVITLYGCYTIAPQSALQYNYNTQNFPNKPVYFLPYGFFTFGLIFTENSNYSKLANNQMTKLFSNGQTIISFINESVPAEAYSAPSPTGFFDINTGTLYRPQTSTDSNFLWIDVNGSSLSVIYNDVYDQIIIFPYQAQDLSIIYHYIGTDNTIRYYQYYEEFGPITGGIKYYLLNLCRSCMSTVDVPRLEFLSQVGKLTNVFLANNPLCGNKLLSSYPFMNNIPAIKVYWNQLQFGTISIVNDAIVITPDTSGSNRYFRYVSNYDGTSGFNSQYFLWYFNTYGGHAPTKIFNRYPNGSWHQSTPQQNIQYGTQDAISIEVYSVTFICWEKSSPLFTGEFDTTYLPAASINPKHIFLQDQSSADFRVPALHQPSCTRWALTIEDPNEQDPNLRFLGGANAPNLFLPNYYGALSFANFNLIEDEQGVPLNRYIEIQTSTMMHDKYAQDQQVQLNLENLLNKTEGYDVESEPMQEGMRFFQGAVDYRKYYRFLHFPQQILTLVIDPGNFIYNTNTRMFEYNRRFSFPQMFPPFTRASMYMQTFNYQFLSRHDARDYYNEAYNNSTLVLYSDLTRKVRSKMVPLLVVNDKYINISFGEIFSSKDFGIYFSTNNEQIDVNSLNNKIYILLA